MILTVHLFAAAREAAGTDHVKVEVKNSATVAGLRTELLKFEKLTALIPRCSIAVNQEFADAGMTLSENDEIAVIPPVSGGRL